MLDRFDLSISRIPGQKPIGQFTHHLWDRTKKWKWGRFAFVEETVRLDEEHRRPIQQWLQASSRTSDSKESFSFSVRRKSHPARNA
jgi:hypothetical protein